MVRSIVPTLLVALLFSACTTPKSDTAAKNADTVVTENSAAQQPPPTTSDRTGLSPLRPDAGGVGELISAVATAEGAVQGKMAPDFTWKGSDGAEHSLKDYQGTAVMINFWGTWCPPCRRELPDIVKLRKEMKADGFEVIGVCLENVPNPAEHVAKFAKENGLEYPLVIANGSGDIEQAYGGIEAVPTTFIVNRKGIITDKLVGMGSEAQFRTMIKKAM